MMFSCRLLLKGLPLKPSRMIWPASRAFHTSTVICAAEQPAAKKQRPSKTAAKREVQQLQKVVSQMCKLSERQLERLRPLLDDRALDAIAEAKRIPGRNQAKSRQEAFVAKMLREELEEADQALLEEAVASVASGQGVVMDPQVERQAHAWLERLLAEDKEVMTQVFAAGQDGDGSGMDAQRLRQLVRQAAQGRQAGEPEEGAGNGAAAMPAEGARQRSQRQRAENELLQELRRLARQQAGAASEDEDES